MKRLNGLYLVVSPILPGKELLYTTEKALEGGVDIVQLSDRKEIANIRPLAEALARLVKNHGKPFLVNNDLAVAKKVGADGVHLDNLDISPSEARKTVGDNALVGYTVNIDLARIKWAEEAAADYVSFCSIFHVCLGGVCPLVSIDTIREARSITNLAIFGAGGVTLENAHLLLEAGADGVVVTSAILKSKDPLQAARAFKEILKNYEK